MSLVTPAAAGVAVRAVAPRAPRARGVQLPRAMTKHRTYLLAVLLVSGCGDDAATPHEPRDLAVRIDVLPGAWPNTTSFDAPAAIDVAILGSPEVDATTVDGASLVA